MKQRLTLLMALLLIFCLVACSGKGEQDPSSKEVKAQSSTADAPATQEKEAELFDAGNVTVPVPEGWKAFSQFDIMSDDPNAVDPDIAQICKGGVTQTDIFSKPYIQINYYGPGSVTTDFELLKEFYETFEMLDPMQIGPYTWEGFSTTDYGSLNIILYTQDGEYQYQASIWCGEGSNTIAVEDADVQQILAGVAHSN